MTGPHRVVFIGMRGAEQGNDRIPFRSDDGAAIFMDAAHHRLDQRPKAVGGLLRVHRFDQLGGLDGVGE